MPTLLENVENALRQQGWAFVRVEGQDVLELQFEAHHTRIPLHIQTFENIRALHVVSRSEHTFGDPHLKPLMELLLRASGQLTIGNFELDWNTTHPIYRVANLFSPDYPVDEKVIAGLVQTAVTEMDRITPALAGLADLSESEIPSYSAENWLNREDLLPPVEEAKDL